MNEYLKSHPVYKYVQRVVDNELITDEEMKIVCNDFLKEVNNPNSKYFFDEKLLKKITQLFGLINMPDGSARDKPVSESLAGFQWFFVANTLCWKMANNHDLRRYHKSIMLLARKSGKTFVVALIFILLLFTEPDLSTFYSVAPDKDLSSVIKNMMQKIIDKSPYIKKYFKWTQRKVTCVATGSTFEPLATSNNRMDARLASCWIGDEIGALKNSYPIEAMTSSQGTEPNRLGILISTAYQTLHNPMTDEVEMASNIIRGKVKNDREFAMLYRPDNPKEWKTSDEEMFKANPLAQDIKDVRDFLFEQRKKAIDMPSSRSNFLTKHMNIFIDGDAGEQYVTETELESSELVDDYDWTGKDVYLGVDLSQSNDNTAVSMSTYDFDKHRFVAKSWAFYPVERQAEKKRIEHIDYPLMDKHGWSFACGARTVDYQFIEKFIVDISQKYGVRVKGIGYDKWNALATINSLQNKGFDVVEISQNASGLYPGTKLLRESIQDGLFSYEKNELLKTNFLNATMVTDMNLSYYLNKKKSNGKIDMVAALVNSFALWNQEIEEEASQITGDLLVF